VRRRARIAIIVSIIAAAAAAGVLTFLAYGSSSLTLTHDGVAAFNGVCVRGPTPTPPPTLKPGQQRTLSTPDLRRDSTRMAEIDGFRKKRYESTRALIASGCDPRNLPMVAVSHLDGGPPQTFDAALDRADLVVIAHVIRTTFSVNEANPIPNAFTTLAVDQPLKGGAQERILLYQAGGPIPDYGGIVGIFEGDPVLFPGDEVLLLAQKRTNADGYWSVCPVGKYYIRDGAVSVPAGSPCDWLNGRSTSDLLQLVSASLSHATQEAVQPCDWSRFE
jgi:hypothetical protein